MVWSLSWYGEMCYLCFMPINNPLFVSSSWVMEYLDSPLLKNDVISEFKKISINVVTQVLDYLIEVINRFFSLKRLQRVFT